MLHCPESENSEIAYYFDDLTTSYFLSVSKRMEELNDKIVSDDALFERIIMKVYNIDMK
jgi:hypothetical protein